MTEKYGIITADSINFAPGTILTGEMLARSYAFPRNYMDINYMDVDDCIVSGMNFIEKSGKVFIKPGIIKYKGEFFFSPEELSLTDLWQNVQKNNEKIAKKGNANNSSFVFVPKAEKCFGNTTVKSMQLIYSNADVQGLHIGYSQIADNNLALPKTIEELIQDRNYIQLLGIKYYSEAGLTFHPYVFKVLRKYLCEKKERDIYDFQLLMLLGSQNVIGLAAIKYYLIAKEIVFKEDSNPAKLFEFLLKAVKKNCKLISENRNNSYKPSGPSDVEKDDWDNDETVI